MSDTQINESETVAPLSGTSKVLVLVAAVLALVFDGFELGLMPIAAQSVTKSMLGAGFSKELGADWFARYTASLFFGAAIGGIYLGRLGDTIGRARALGISVLFYSIFAGIGGYATTLNEMLLLRFFVGLGVGGVWPNAVALAAECWPNKSRPIIAGLMGAALNSGIVLLSQITQISKDWNVTVDSWRWLFHLAAFPAVLGVVILVALPESPTWLAMRKKSKEQRDSAEKKSTVGLRQLFSPPLLRTMVIGIALGAVPLIGAWAASKWVIPWSESVAGEGAAAYKSQVQAYWAYGAVLGSFFGAQIAAALGRRVAYAGISIGATALTLSMFLLTKPLNPEFVWVVFAQGFVATLFFGWLPLYLPELFPTSVRTTGTGISYNAGRFITAFAVLGTTSLAHFFSGAEQKIGATCSLIYALGAIVILYAPDTTKTDLDK